MAKEPLRKHWPQLTVKIEPKLYDQFRKKASDKLGYGSGVLQDAIEEALRMYVKS